MAWEQFFCGEAGGDVRELQSTLNRIILGNSYQQGLNTISTLIWHSGITLAYTYLSLHTHTHAPLQQLQKTMTHATRMLYFNFTSGHTNIYNYGQISK